MANVFAILSAIALAAAAFLAMKNKDAYETEINDRKSAETKLGKSEARLAALTDDFNATEKERKQTQSDVEGLKGQESAEKTKVQKSQADVDEKKKLTEANAKKIDEITKQTEGIGEVNELAGKVKTLSEELSGVNDQIASNSSILSDLMREKSRTEGVIGDYRTKNSNFSNKVSYFASTRIGSIYPAYGFVTIPLGASAGVVPGSTLNVVRDDTVIAKLRVRSVESGRAAAEIIPDSQAADTTLMVGDRVVPSKENAPVTSAPAPAPNGKKPAAAPATPAAPAAAEDGAPTLPTEATPAPEATPSTTKEESADPFGN